MKRLSHLGVAVAMLALLSSSSPQPVLAAPNVFTAHLSGSDVVPPADTRATGAAKFTLNPDAAQLQYRINVGNIENVVKASLRLGMPGQNGEEVAVLYGPAPAGGGKKTGVLTAGTITQATLVGSLSGRPLSDLIDAMRAGNVYVVVSTDNGLGSTERQAGNYPDGEVRGQIR